MASKSKLTLGKSSKVVTSQLPFFDSFFTDLQSVQDFNPLPSSNTMTPRNNSFSVNLNVSNDYSNICVDCKGGKFLCGRLRCPIVEKINTFKEINPEIQSKNLFGASPPSVFIGRIGYPHVFLGPMVPPESGNTVIYDDTEQWFGLSQKNILQLRLNLVRGKFKANVKDLSLNNRLLDLTKEIGLAKDSIESEMNFKKIPIQQLKFDDNVQPMGPTATIQSFSLGTSKTDHTIEKYHSDTDLLARDALIQLKLNGSKQTDITRAFSLGLFGIEKTRKMVPTRWSITAVDSTLGLHYWKRIQQYPVIDEVRIFESTYMANRFIIMMIPSTWKYELMEAWFPNSAWNPGRNIALVNDYEGYKGRKNYARIGGCYYSGRNIVGEYLENEQKQASTIIMRETYPGQDMPMGVWLVREMVRKALEFPYMKFDTKQEAWNYISSRLLVKPDYWQKNSGVYNMHSEKIQFNLQQFY
jgi:hypothetical protein